MKNNNVLYNTETSCRNTDIPARLMNNLLESERNNSCLMASKVNSRNNLRPNFKSGNLVEPYRGLYVRTEIWNNMHYKDRVRFVATGISQKIKMKKWKFTASTGAALLGLEVVALPTTHANNIEIFIACSKKAKRNHEINMRKIKNPVLRNQIKKIAIQDIIKNQNGIYLDSDADNFNKLDENTNFLTASSFGHIATDEELAISHVASIYNVLYVCAWKGSFAESLATFDSAARKGEDLNKILCVCRKFYGSMDCCNDTPQFLNSVQNPKNADFYGVNYSPINNPNFLGTDEFDVLSRMETLVNYANPKSENGGESLARAVMLELGFVEPELQHEFPNPNYPQSPYRADFMWKVNGKIIVGEFDGTDKYLIEDRTLPDNRSAACDLRTEDFDGSVENINNFSTNNLYRYNRDAVRKERNRERWLMDCGVVRVVRFDYCDILNPLEFKKKLLSAGIPVAVA